MKLFGGKGNHTGSSAGRHTTRQQPPAPSGGKKLYQEREAERRLREIRKIQDELSRLAHTIRKAADEFEAAEARTKASMSASGGAGSGGGGEW